MEKQWWTAAQVADLRHRWAIVATKISVAACALGIIIGGLIGWTLAKL